MSLKTFLYLKAEDFLARRGLTLLHSKPSNDEHLATMAIVRVASSLVPSGSLAEATDKILDSFKISQITVSGNLVILVTGRPGVVIGPRGSVLEKITKEISETLKRPVQVRIRENRYMGWITYPAWDEEV